MRSYQNLFHTVLYIPSLHHVSIRSTFIITSSAYRPSPFITMEETKCKIAASLDTYVPIYIPSS